jgi:TBC1 domain family protein 5
LLALWDVLLAEDPGLELIDMVCVAMLLRIRWQCKPTCPFKYIYLVLTICIVIDASYSFALMLLLKYPVPNAENGPQTFVDDAIYLRDNFSAAGGANIISKYSGRAPSISATDSRPATPLEYSLSLKRSFARTKSPLPSPARFLHQQGGIEGLFQGARKGVFDRGERLGINQAVRDAVGEVKKNMQGLQASRNNSTRRRTSDVTRWSLDEGKAIPASRASVSAINARNKQLARMLEQAMIDLRAASVSPDGDKETYTAAMDLAIAKVEFVKVYLEDSTMPLPEVLSHAESPGVTPLPVHEESLQSTLLETPELPTPDSRPHTPPANSKMKSLQASPISDIVPPTREHSTQDAPSNATPSINLPADGDTESGSELSIRPKAPVPTRSSIAQSSFSWMLEPDTNSNSTQNSMTPKSSVCHSLNLMKLFEKSP